jgi:phage FluMu protein Com
MTARCEHPGRLLATARGKVCPRCHRLIYPIRKGNGAGA